MVNSLEKKVNEMSKKYVVTSAQYGARVNKNFLKSLNMYAKYNNAEILMLPIKGSYKDRDEMSKNLDDYHFIHRDSKLNNKIRVYNYAIRPQQIDPVSGLGRLTQSDVSTIFASPKLRMKVIPNSNTKLPKVLMTTGAVTLPDYRDNRVGKIGEHDHTYGAIIIETEGNNKYQYRQLNSLKNGKFCDLGVLYNGNNKPKKVRPEAMVLGDWHFGDLNKKVEEETYSMIKKYKPKRIILHDLFDGSSINYWDKNKIATKARKKNKLNLNKELKGVYDNLKKIVKLSPKDSEIIVVRSNHDERLDRYIEGGDFIYEPQNTYLGAKLLQDKIEGGNLLEKSLSAYGKIPDNVNFLNLDEDYKYKGWQLGVHGHKGASGARGSIRSIEYANGKSITGHSHSPQIFRNAWVVGTSTKLKLDYVKGFSGWMNTHAMLYNTGTTQLINIINGKHRY